MTNFICPYCKKETDDAKAHTHGSDVLKDGMELTCIYCDRTTKVTFWVNPKGSGKDDWLPLDAGYIS